MLNAKSVPFGIGKQSKWLTHGRSIKIENFEEMGLKITDFSKDKDLNEAILRYYTLLRISFETNIYKIFETIDSQIYRFAVSPGSNPQKVKGNDVANIDFECPRCKNHFLIQANLGKTSELRPSHYPFPVGNNIFQCPKCGMESNLIPIRLQIEAQSGKKIL